MAKSEKCFFHAQKQEKGVGRALFCGLSQRKIEKNQFGGNNNYGKKVLLSLH
ncbi:MAG: hypothetical protein IJX49_06170 [Clostridia bacterium]|nr:hypothetical protein [Clostridia bacterium]